MSSLTVEEDQKWLPTHVQVTVLRGRGLRGKGKHGTSDVYTIIQLGKEKYSTGVAEKTTEPEWREECSFELQPGVLENGGRSGGGCPAGSNELVLIAMHRAVMGLDVFLGQAVVQLDKVFHETRCVKNEWYKLNSKTGKKEKERGDIQVTVQFTRNNLTASMYDLVMKDKGASTFGKLKERIKGKRRSSEEDSASAVLPSGYGSLYRMRQRLPSDGGGEEDYEDDEGGEARRSKMRTFFLRGKLRKSSDTRSSTSLGSESSESSSRGGSLSPTAGISVVVSDLSNSPSNSSNLTVDNSPEHTANTSPKSSSLKCEFDDEAGEITIAVPPPTVCVNGSHAYNVQPPDPGSGKAATSLGLGSLQKSLPLSVSLQNLRPSTNLPKSPVGDGRRWSFDKPGEEEKAAIAAALEQSGPMLGDEKEESGQQAASAASSSSSESQGKKQRRNFFSSGRSESAGKGPSQCRDESEQAPAATEDKHKGWFGSKESHSKPSLVVSPKLEPSTDPHPPTHHPPGPPVDPAPLVSPLHHTNPFFPSQTTTPPPLSPCNPFFSLLQHNPFYDDPLTAQPLKPPLPPPPLPYLSSARPPIAQLFPQASNPTLTHDPTTTEDSAVTGTDAKRERPLPPPPEEGESPLNRKLSNPFMCASLDPDSEWDESFEAFAAGRLQSPEDLTKDCKTQQNSPLEHCSDGGALLPGTDQNQPCTDFIFDAHKTAFHLDSFAHFLETIPEHASFESDINTNSLKLDSETNQATNNVTDTTTTTTTTTHPRHASPVKLNSSSPDPGSSGLGSSAEEDFLSCVSSYSDKFSASSSSEEAEAQLFESNILGFEKSSVVKNVKRSESEDDATDRSTDLTLVDVAQHAVGDGDEKVDLEGLKGSKQFSMRTHLQPVISERETGSEGSNTDFLPERSNISLQHDDENRDTSEFNEFEDFSKDDSSIFVHNTTDDDKLCSTYPSLCIITSSPDVRKSSSDSHIEGLGGGQRSPIPFGDFLNSPTSRDSDDPPLHDQSAAAAGSSFLLQSLYVSVDSQDYQTCESAPSSRCSTLHSACSTLCGEPSEIQTAADDEETDRKTATLEPNFIIGDNFDLLPYMSCDSKKLTDAIVGDVFSKSAALHRSQSEGTLISSFDDLLLPSFGSDPVIQESSSAPPGPDLPSLTSFAPSLLTPQSSPVALCPLPPFANATARSPQASAPVLQDAQQQQAANQQNSPHPVKPLTTATLAEEKRTEGRSVLATGLEKLKSTIHPGRSSQLSEPDTDRKKPVCVQPVTEGAGSYYHLNHSELVALLVQREAELERQRAEFERQKSLLAKREVELKKLKPQVKDLEDYIDTLLVRIMEQKPTLLQVRSKLK